MIEVEVAYATPEKQRIFKVQVSEGASMLEAVKKSALLEVFPEVNLESVKMGVFSKIEAKPEARILQAGDRVEVYRPLIADPKAARKARAEKLQVKKKD